jgi:hypothetical protein
MLPRFIEPHEAPRHRKMSLQAVSSPHMPLPPICLLGRDVCRGQYTLVRIDEPQSDKLAMARLRFVLETKWRDTMLTFAGVSLFYRN